MSEGIAHTAATADEVLVWVNEQRLAYNLGRPLVDLPKGVRDDCEACPLARALHGTVDGVFARIQDWFDADMRIELPPRIGAWTAAFDEGEFPELVA